MAMLAEPRRKQKIINLRAKNNAWSNDSSKFGQRMLEKMGWSSGKGLGANENGIVEHVIAKYKNDDRGLGFEDRNDQWTKHEDDFNSLLANLSNGDAKEEKLHSGVSLEEKSKKSKARVHYHKYTRGKDLTRYSEKDLANIFGKKTFKGEEKVPEILKPDELKSTEVIFTEKGSMEDYFKNKLAALKGKNKVTFLNNYEDGDADYTFRGFAGTYTEESEVAPERVETDVAFQGFSFNESNEDKTSEEPFEDESPKKKSKKNKKPKKLEESESYENTSPNNTIEPVSEANPFEDEPPKKKSKKNKKPKKLEESESYENTSPNNAIEPIKKKSKKNKHTIIDESEICEKVTKKKKSKNKNVEDHQVIEESIDEVAYVPKKKKKRKNKNDEM